MPLLTRPSIDWKNPAVYLLAFPNGKGYVGQTCQPLDKRYAAHRSLANRGSNQAVHAAWRKYGAPALVQLHGVDEAQAIIACNTRAPFGYNLSDGGESGFVGGTHSRNARARISAALRLRPRPPRKPKPPPVSKKELGRRISAALKGRSMSAAARRNMRAAALRRYACRS